MKPEPRLHESSAAGSHVSPGFRFLVTCEHGGNDVPGRYTALFQTPGAAAALHSHRGHDPGALRAATRIAESLGVELIASTTTRLLVDLNRSLDNATLFSEYSQPLSPSDREQLLDEHYHPYRNRVRSTIENLLATQPQPLVQLSIHSFTSLFRGRWRPLDVGLLFDPHSRLERELCETWQRRLSRSQPRLRVAMNQPYAGTDDGLTTHLRTRFPSERYAGIEIEISNRFYKRNVQQHDNITNALTLAMLPGK